MRCWRQKRAPRHLYRRFAALFRRHDLLLTPATPHGAPPADTVYHTQGYDRRRDVIPYTLPFNLIGLPAASLPCGLTAEGLPVGLQVVGPKFAERAVLEASLAIEGAGGVRARARAGDGGALTPRTGRPRPQRKHLAISAPVGA